MLCREHNPAGPCLLQSPLCAFNVVQFASKLIIQHICSGKHWQAENCDMNLHREFAEDACLSGWCLGSQGCAPQVVAPDKLRLQPQRLQAPRRCCTCRRRDLWQRLNALSAGP